MLALCGCVGATSRSSIAVQNNTGDAELAAYAAQALEEQLKARGIRASDFELVTRLDVLDDGSLQLKIICSGRIDHLLKGQVQVKGRGPQRKLIRSMMSEAVRDLAADCR